MEADPELRRILIINDLQEEKTKDIQATWYEWIIGPKSDADRYIQINDPNLMVDITLCVQ